MGKSKIDSETWYTLSQLVKLDAFPFCGTDIRRYRSAVQSDMKSGNILKTMTRGSGMGLRYNFKGSNIIQFLLAVENGKVKF